MLLLHTGRDSEFSDSEAVAKVKLLPEYQGCATFKMALIQNSNLNK